jgi:hypothetical protein
MQRTLLTLALIATAGVSYAQTLPAGQPTDSYGRPMNYGGNVATVPPAQPMAPATQPAATGEKTTRNNKLERDHATGPEPIPMDATGRRQAAFKDEYGFRYDSQGNRLDARGNIISPHIPQR